MLLRPQELAQGGGGGSQGCSNHLHYTLGPGLQAAAVPDPPVLPRERVCEGHG